MVAALLGNGAAGYPPSRCDGPGCLRVRCRINPWRSKAAAGPSRMVGAAEAAGDQGEVDDEPAAQRILASPSQAKLRRPPGTSCCMWSLVRN
jgi:hypothetical protein